MAKTSQNDRVLRHLQTFGKITPIQALQEYGIMRLASRISDLKKEGYEIERTFKRHVNKFGESTHYAVYELKE